MLRRISIAIFASLIIALPLLAQSAARCAAERKQLVANCSKSSTASTSRNRCSICYSSHAQCFPTR